MRRIKKKRDRTQFYVIRHSPPIQGVGRITTLFSTSSTESGAVEIMRRAKGEYLPPKSSATFEIVEAPLLRKP